MKESQRELIRELADVSNCGIEVKLKQEFPEAFETKLEVGKWYRDDKNTKHIFCLTGELSCAYSYYGFTCEGDWVDCSNYYKSACDIFIKATKKEVEEALIKEAKRRGFVEGNKFTRNKEQFPPLKGEYKCGELTFKSGILLCDGLEIFVDGKWADVVKHKELTVAQIEKELGYKVKIVKE